MKVFKTLAVLTLAVTALALPTWADHHVNTSSGMLLEGGPLALRGFDPVAYFTKNKAVEGSHTITAVHDGAVYQFVSEANKKAFEGNPAKYVPAYGGFCAFGVAAGAKFDGDPRVWKIVDGRLYLNLNRDIQAKWQEDVPGNIQKAETNWKKIRSTPAANLN